MGTIIRFRSVAPKKASGKVPILLGQTWLHKKSQEWFKVIRLESNGELRVIGDASWLDEEHEANYSESYFRRNFVEKSVWIARRNEKVQRRKRAGDKLLLDMLRLLA